MGKPSSSRAYPLAAGAARQFLEELGITGHEASLDERCRRVEVAFRQFERFAAGEHAMAEFHALIPDRIPETFRETGDFNALFVQENHVEIGLWAKLRSAVAADGYQRHASGTLHVFGEEFREPRVDPGRIGTAKVAAIERGVD